MAFSFGFSGDDIDETMDVDVGVGEAAPASAGGVENGPPLVEPKVLRVEDVLATLPSKISYSTLTITSPQGRSVTLPRRELFDVRLQLMAEDEGADGADGSGSSSSADAIAGLDDADIRTNVYEGGFKSWECSVDLVKLLLDRGPRKDLDDLCRVDHVVELGCGTALPTLLLFQHALAQSLPLYFTLADYNASVLRLVTLPNLLLVWASTLPADAPVFTPEHPSPFHFPSSPPDPSSPTQPETGDLDLTPALLAAFLTSLHTSSLHLTLLAGSWAPPDRFAALVPSAPDMRTLLLGSETIYSPAALEGFADACAALMASGRGRNAKLLVAAKRVYFGVGGGVDAFREACAARGVVMGEV
ncbi:uncharacterized protein K452DRAFT_192530, partial [Aplosporella prunicola CBS 121167]